MLNNAHKEALGYLPSLQTALLGECRQLVDPSDMARANVLEVGCGYGTTTTQIVDLFPNVREVLGVDRDQDAIDYAFNYVADEKMDFSKGDIEDSATFDMSWAGKFDWAFSSHALLFVRDHASALRNLMWCMKPGGRCFMAVPAAKPSDFHAAVKKVIAIDGFRKHFQQIADLVSDMTESNCNRLWFHHPHADRVYSALLEQVGYQVLNTKLFDFKYTFSSVDEYKECLHFLIEAVLQHIPQEKQDSVFKDFYKVALKKVRKTSKGSVSWNIKYVMVLAKRPQI